MQEPVRNELCSILAGLPNYAMIGTGRDDGKEKGEYTCILYRTERFRVLDNGTYWLTETPTVHSKVEGSTHYRIATWGLFEDKETGAQFLYTNTHLSYDSEPVKDYQLRIMKPTMKALNEKYGTDLPHYMTGDFNMLDYENKDGTKAEACKGSNYQLCLNLGVIMKDMWIQARSRKHYSLGNVGPEGRIDYIFASRKVSCNYAQWDWRKTAEDGFWMSDHDPLWADTYFTTSAADNARAAINKAQSLIDSTYSLRELPIKLISYASQLSTDGTESGNTVDKVLDGNTSTFCHSLYSTTPENQPHYLQVMLRRDVTDCRFTYLRRNDANYGISDRWQDVMVTASNDGNTWDYITEFYDLDTEPFSVFKSENIYLRKPYRYLRFNVMHTPGEKLRNGNPQYACAEFQLYENYRLPESERFVSEEIGRAADSLEALIATTQELIEAGTISSTDVDNLVAATNALNEARENYASSIMAPNYNKAEETIYSIDGLKRPSLQKGINIVIQSNNNRRKVLVKYQ